MESFKRTFYRVLIHEGTDLSAADVDALADKMIADDGKRGEDAPKVIEAVNPFPWRGGKAYKLDKEPVIPDDR